MSDESPLDVVMWRRREEQRNAEAERQRVLAARETEDRERAAAWALEYAPIVEDFVCRAHALRVPPEVLPLTEVKRYWLKQRRGGGVMNGPYQELRFQFRSRPSTISAWRVKLPRVSELIVSTDGRVVVPSPRKRVGGKNECAHWPTSRSTWEEYYSSGWVYAAPPTTFYRDSGSAEVEPTPLSLVDVLVEWLENHGQQ